MADPAFTYKKYSRKRIGAYRDGVFLCWLDTETRSKTGLTSERYTLWSCLQDGKILSAGTLAGLKDKLEGRADPKDA